MRRDVDIQILFGLTTPGPIQFKFQVSVEVVFDLENARKNTLNT